MQVPSDQGSLVLALSQLNSTLSTTTIRSFVGAIRWYVCFSQTYICIFFQFTFLVFFDARRNQTIPATSFTDRLILHGDEISSAIVLPNCFPLSVTDIACDLPLGLTGSLWQVRSFFLHFFSASHCTFCPLYTV